MMPKIVEVKDLKKYFPVKKSFFGFSKSSVKAVREITFDIFKGETLGVVGESGCGKSTLAMLILRLIDPDGGRIVFDEDDITHKSQNALRGVRRNMQIIFQDPYASLNPRMKVGDIIAEPFVVHKIGDRKERRRNVMRLLDIVGLPPKSYDRYPHEFSGGQRQRIGIARAIALNPKFIIGDEPVSALDISIRGEILNLLEDLKKEFELTYLFISHDLNVVRYISDRIMVMYLGKIMETFPADRIDDARHPYTRALVSAVPVADTDRRRKRIVLSGDVPSPVDPPSGCPFHPRCPHAKEICAVEEPEFREYENGISGACHFIERL